MTLPAQTRTDRRSCSGYLAVLFIIILGFVGVMAAMQVLVLTSVASTTRAYDSFRQRSTNLLRVERIVSEAVLDQVQVSLAERGTDAGAALDSRLRQVVLSGASLTRTGSLPGLQRPAIFPDAATVPDALQAIGADVQTRIPPELAALVGPRAALYPEVEYTFELRTQILEQTRTERLAVTAMLLAAPLTRFPVAAYELPHDIGATTGPARALVTQQPLGLAPGRDPAFRTGLQSNAGALPYHYRRRAALAAAYQYVFSDAFITRVVEYAGVTHFVDLAAGVQPQLDGLVVVGTAAAWDLAQAGLGRISGVELARDAAVVVSEQAGHRMRLHDSGSAAGTGAILLLLLGPTDLARGPLVVQLESIGRPVVLIGCNVSVECGAGVAVEGAVFLDPASSLQATGPVTFGHLSYWAGAGNVSATRVQARPLPTAAELIAPRVVYCATRASRL